MSVHGGAGVEIRLLAELMNSIIELGSECRQLNKMKTSDGKIHDVELVTTDENGRQIGFQKGKKGDYRIIADCAGLNREQLKKQEQFVKKIKQRYSYKMVIGELKKQGYVIAEEEKVQNNTIRIVARKWS